MRIMNGLRTSSPSSVVAWIPIPLRLRAKPLGVTGEERSAADVVELEEEHHDSLETYDKWTINSSAPS